MERIRPTADVALDIEIAGTPTAAAGSDRLKRDSRTHTYRQATITISAMRGSMITAIDGQAQVVTIAPSAAPLLRASPAS